MSDEGLQELVRVENVAPRAERRQRQRKGPSACLEIGGKKALHGVESKTCKVQRRV